MEGKTITSHDPKMTTNEEDEGNESFQDFVNKLEQQTNWDGRPLVRYEGFLVALMCLRPMISCRKHFKARDEDIIVTTLPKSGTTWLKALAFAIAKRKTYDPFDDQTHPLLSKNPHTLVPFLEYSVYMNEENPDLEHVQEDPRIFGTHIPFGVLPNSILESKCKIIYLCRNPLDQFVSYRHFSLGNDFRRSHNHAEEPLGLNESFELFCNGIHHSGPFWDHVLGYWNAHVRNPDKVMFLKYEDLKEDDTLYVRKIAEFLGYPFSPEEELDQGVVEHISRLCSFDKLSNLEVNKTGGGRFVKYSTLFRKGEVGDWRNHLTPEMAERVQKIMETKFKDTGLTFELDES